MSLGECEVSESVGGKAERVVDFWPVRSDLQNALEHELSLPIMLELLKAAA